MPECNEQHAYVTLVQPSALALLQHVLQSHAITNFTVLRNVRPQDSEYVVGSGAVDTDKSSPATKLNQSGPQADSAPIMAMV